MQKVRIEEPKNNVGSPCEWGGIHDFDSQIQADKNLGQVRQ